ncbi:MAG TPA: Rne/Rng family ribonuclease [Caulobacteraceae bacterium]|nr:Rne/Rng family ribonuclease [Caulobacteraceae bacterium]
MPKKMLIDAAHPEETRVVVLNGNQVEDFDFESRAKKQLRGNIYLAKVTRVEPSLQAAFVEYGGNRHGFLAFNEIHPDYYQIPHADREALLREAEEDDDEDEESDGEASADDQTDSLGGEDEDEVDEEIARRRRRLMRRYKIQEVIKRRQIMLVQVVKEERGTKGAALTTYLSLAGRYCVLMPNTDRGGGISRKITAASDRKRLRGIVADMDVPEGMGLIVRTAGAKRTKAEIKRDYEYLSRAWSQIRDTTLHSIAPALIYEEEDLVKRAIRDLFDKDIDGIWVEGEAGFREARKFMRMLMPSQASKIQLYRGAAPLFVANKIEEHLSQIYSPVVPLRSGGYLVINQTEALVAIDVNSGRATRERNIEATALKTNLEAAEEAARQLRLRDLAGLVIIDFIDMDEGKNNRAVEKTLKDCLAKDRARIQMGKISAFGLMEISRQRRRTGILEGTTHVCPHCNGAGRVRSVESSALAALRAVELEGLNGGGEISLRVPKDVGLYILNTKREYLTRLAVLNGVFVNVTLDDALAHADHEVERVSDTPYQAEHAWGAPAVEDLTDEEVDAEIELEEEEEDEAFAESFDDVEAGLEDDEDEDLEVETVDAGHSRDDEEGAGRRRRGRRRRGRRGDEGRPAEGGVAAPASSEAADADPRRRRRGRRGGRRTREEGQAHDAYAWAWPARLSGDNPYEWRGPSQQRSVPIAEAPRPAAIAAEPSRPEPVEMREEPVAIAEGPPADLMAASIDEGPMQDVWVELPPVEEKPARTRRRRSTARGRGAAGAEPEGAPDTPSPEPESEPGPETPQEMPGQEPPLEIPAPAESPPGGETPTRAAEPVVETSAAEVVELRPEPAPAEAAPREPDPAEIVTPPTAPRRGWWRRGT